MANDDVAELKRQISELQNRLTRIESMSQDVDPQPTEPEADVRRSLRPGPMSRRALFNRAGLIAAGVGGASLVAISNATPAAASTGTMMYGTSNSAGDSQTQLFCNNNDSSFYIYNNGSGSCLQVESLNGFKPAVRSTIYPGAPGAEPAVFGSAQNQFGSGVRGEATNLFNTGAGVWGETGGTGSGVYGRNFHPRSTAAVFGDSREETTALWGRNTGQSRAGVGVRGHSDSGRGGVFEGKRAPLKLQPSTTASHPDKGQRGDFFVDKSGRLWFCKGQTNWKQIA